MDEPRQCGNAHGPQRRRRGGVPEGAGARAGVGGRAEQPRVAAVRRKARRRGGAAGAQGRHHQGARPLAAPRHAGAHSRRARRLRRGEDDVPPGHRGGAGESHDRARGDRGGGEYHRGVFSQRVRWHAPLNRLTIERRKRGDLLDLTETNPTRAGIDYPHDELAEIFARAARAPYDPDPRGLRSAREALGDPDDVILTASTSEAYSFLFRLLADPGEAMLAP